MFKAIGRANTETVSFQMYLEPLELIYGNKDKTLDGPVVLVWEKSPRISTSKGLYGVDGRIKYPGIPEHLPLSLMMTMYRGKQGYKKKVTSLKAKVEHPKKGLQNLGKCEIDVAEFCKFDGTASSYEKEFQLTSCVLKCRIHTKCTDNVGMNDTGMSVLGDSRVNSRSESAWVEEYKEGNNNNVNSTHDDVNKENENDREESISESLSDLEKPDDTLDNHNINTDNDINTPLPVAIAAAAATTVATLDTSDNATGGEDAIPLDTPSNNNNNSTQSTPNNTTPTAHMTLTSPRKSVTNNNERISMLEHELVQVRLEKANLLKSHKEQVQVLEHDKMSIETKLTSQIAVLMQTKEQQEQARKMDSEKLHQMELNMQTYQDDINAYKQNNYQLETMLHTMEMDVEQKKEENKKVQKKLDSLQDELKHVQLEAASYKNSASTEDVVDSVVNIAEMEVLREQLNSLKANSDNEKNELREELRDNTDALKASVAENSRLQEQIGIQMSKLTAYEAEVKNNQEYADNRIVELVERLKGTSSELQVTKTELIQVRQENDSFKMKMLDVLNENKNLVSNEESLNKKLEHLVSENTVFITTNEELLNENVSYKEETKVLQSKLGTLERDLQSQLQQASYVNNAEDSEHSNVTTGKIIELEQELLSLQQKYDIVEHDLTHASDISKQQKDKIILLSGEKSSLLLKYDTVENKLEECQRTVTELNVRIDTVLTEHRDLQVEYNSILDEFDSMGEKCMKLENTIVGLKKELDTVEQEKRSLGQDKVRLSAQVVELQEKVHMYDAIKSMTNDKEDDERVINSDEEETSTTEDMKIMSPAVCLECNELRNHIAHLEQKIKTLQTHAQKAFTNERLIVELESKVAIETRKCQEALKNSTEKELDYTKVHDKLKNLRKTHDILQKKYVALEQEHFTVTKENNNQLGLFEQKIENLENTLKDTVQTLHIKEKLVLESDVQLQELDKQVRNLLEKNDQANLNYHRYVDVSSDHIKRLETESALYKRESERAKSGEPTLSAKLNELLTFWREKGAGSWFGFGDKKSSKIITSAENDALQVVIGALAEKLEFLEAELNSSDTSLFQVKESFSDSIALLRSTNADLEKRVQDIEALKSQVTEDMDGQDVALTKYKQKVQKLENNMLKLREVSSRMEMQLLESKAETKQVSDQLRQANEERSKLMQKLRGEDI